MTSLIGLIKLKQRGFTLVEILLVVIILTVIAAVTIPNFSPTFTRLQLKNSVQNLTYMMRYAQSRAVTRNTEVRLVFESDFSQYWLEEHDKEDADSIKKEFVRVKGKRGADQSIDEEFTVEMESSVEEIGFYTDGQIDKVRIYVCHEERCFTISTKEQRGFVHVFEEKIRG